jgi:hypothetical protein
MHPVPYGSLFLLKTGGKVKKNSERDQERQANEEMLFFASENRREYGIHSGNEKSRDKHRFPPTNLSGASATPRNKIHRP